MRLLYLFFLLTTFIVFFNTVESGPPTNLRVSQNPIFPTTNVETESNGNPVLRAQQKTDETIDSDDEERGAFANLRNNFIQKVQNWLKNMKLARAKRVKYKQMVKTVQAQDLSNLDEAVNNLMKQGINHDQVYSALKLSKEKNQWMSMSRDSPFYNKRSPKYKLWEQLREAVLHQRANS